MESLTDNRNRTASEIRSIFSRHGGHLGESGSVSFLFEHVGFLRFPIEVGAFDAVFEAVLAAEANDLEVDGESYIVTTPAAQLNVVREKLHQTIGDPIEARLIWHPLSTVVCEEGTAESVMRLMEALDDNDDVQFVYTNAA